MVASVSFHCNYPFHCVPFFLITCVCVFSIAQSRPALCDPTGCGSPGSSAHVVFQARILEWVVISYFKESSHSRDEPTSSVFLVLARRILYDCATREALLITYLICISQIYIIPLISINILFTLCLFF